MRLYTTEWGNGNPKQAILIHDLMGSGQIWRRVATELANRSYHVIAVDLRGHGRSGRGDYTTKLFAKDILETIPHSVDLMIGQSYGGTLVNIVSGVVKPEKAIYVDPKFIKRGGKVSGIKRMYLASTAKRAAKLDKDTIAKKHHTWHSEDVEAEKESCSQWDPESLLQLTRRSSFKVPTKMPVPSLAVIAGEKSSVTPLVQDKLKQLGYEVVTVPGTYEANVFRDDFEGFMSAINDWV